MVKHEANRLIKVNKNNPLIALDTTSDIKGRYVTVSGSLFNTPVILVSVYAPNCDYPKFFNNLIHSLAQIDTH